MKTPNATLSIQERRSNGPLRKHPLVISDQLSAGSNPLVVLDQEGRIILFNQAFARVTGYTLNDVNRKHVWDDLRAPEEVPLLRAMILGLSRNQRPIQYEGIWNSREGDLCRISWSLSAALDDALEVRVLIGLGIVRSPQDDPLYGSNGSAQGVPSRVDTSPRSASMKDGREHGPEGDSLPALDVRSTNRDASETGLIEGQVFDVAGQDRPAAELGKTKAWVDAILETTPDTILGFDATGHLHSFNPAGERLFGYSARELVGRPLSVILPSWHIGSHSFEEGGLVAWNAYVSNLNGEVEGRKKDGTVFPLHASLTSAEKEGHRLWVTVLRDLTEHKRMQKELVLSQRLAAVGEMAASIVHEVQNPLAAIEGVIGTLRERRDAHDPDHSLLGDVLTQIHRLNRSVEQLLLLSKPWDPKKEFCDLRMLSEWIVGFAKNQEPFGQILFSFRGESGLKAWVDPSLFEQVFWNLVLNAAQAMPVGGEICLAFSETPLTVEVSIEDNGTGMSPDSLGKVFIPYFTTKPEGTGLGLPISRRIMEAHGGTIGVTSSIGKGTRFTLSFPKVGEGLDQRDQP